MGTWGAGPFENDDAIDLLFELENLDTIERSGSLEQIFLTVIDKEAYIQADDGQATIAAAAIVASQLPGGRSMTLVNPPNSIADDFVPVEGSIIQLAVLALARVSGAESEIATLWRDVNGTDIFYATVAQIERVLSSQTARY